MTLLVKVAAAVAGAAAAGWWALVKVQGDSLMVFEPSALRGVTGDDHTLHGEISIANRGKAGGVVHRVEGRIVDGPRGRVLVTLQGSRTERGWWRSNVLNPGESCVAEVEIELTEAATGPVEIELDAHEIGRRLKVHRVVRLRVTPPTHS